jgi:hypothetical protein
VIRELPAKGLQVRRHWLLPATAELLRSCDVDATQAVALADQHHIVALTTYKKPYAPIEEENDATVCSAPNLRSAMRSHLLPHLPIALAQGQLCASPVRFRTLCSALQIPHG